MPPQPHHHLTFIKCNTPGAFVRINTEMCLSSQNLNQGIEPLASDLLPLHEKCITQSYVETRKRVIGNLYSVNTYPKVLKY